MNKTAKTIIWVIVGIALFCLLFFTSGNHAVQTKEEKAYEDGYKEGYREGYKEGYDEGYRDGYYDGANE